MFAGLAYIAAALAFTPADAAKLPPGSFEVASLALTGAGSAAGSGAPTCTDGQLDFSCASNSALSVTIF
jgi:hypothetical protein